MVHHDNICPELIGKLRACFIERLAEPLARPVTPEKCIVTIAGKRQPAGLPRLVVAYAASFDVALAGLGINDSHAGQDMLASRLLQECDLSATLRALPSEYLRACHPPVPAAARVRLVIEAMRQMDRPRSHEARARFSEFKPYERLLLTHVMDFLPGVKPYESTIEVEFFSLGDAVRMVVTLYPLHDDEFTRMAIEGLKSQLANLDRRFQIRRQ